MNPQRCRWGILSTATIAQKNWRGIYHSGNATVTAVASRDAERAKEFIDVCQAASPMSEVPQALGSYQAMLDSDAIDAVYIPLPTGLRKEWIIRAAEKGKHVLAEKPAGLSTADVKEVIQACREHNVQYMDGVMFMHSDRLPAIRQVIDAGEIGEVRRIVTQFSFNGGDEFLEDNIRVQSELEPTGCVGDLGWYNIRFALWLMGGDLPQRVAGRCLSAHHRADSRQAVPTEFSAELFFASGVTCSFYCSFISGLEQWIHIGGSQGSIQVPDFVLPHFNSQVEFTVSKPSYYIEGCDFNMEANNKRYSIAEYATGAHNSQETKMVRRFSELVRNGQTDDQWPSIALKTQQVLDACLTSAANGSDFVEP